MYTSGQSGVCRSARRPVIDLEFWHRKVAHVRGGKRRANANRGRTNETIGLVQRHPAPSELATPGASALAFRGTKRCNTQSAKESMRDFRFVITQTAPDIFDDNRARPRLDTFASQIRDLCGGWPTA